MGGGEASASHKTKATPPSPKTAGGSKPHAKKSQCVTHRRTATKSRGRNCLTTRAPPAPHNPRAEEPEDALLVWVN